MSTRKTRTGWRRFHLRPIGMHPVVVRSIRGNRLRIGPIEAIDGTPVVDIRLVLK